MTAPVALVLVSHSHLLAVGACELAQQMAPDVEIVAVGGLPGGELGTSFDRVGDAVRGELRAGRGVVLLADLGSAMLTVDSVIELLEEQEAAGVRLADAPFVEGAVAAAVTAQGGGDLVAVLASAERAGTLFGPAASAPAPLAPGGGTLSAAPRSALDEPTAHRTVTLRNALGLHARPAAVLARLVASFDATVQVDGVDGASVLELMKLGATGGRDLAVRATGPEAQRAVDAIAVAVESAFGEV